jgi:hypothetical protein
MPCIEALMEITLAAGWVEAKEISRDRGDGSAASWLEVEVSWLQLGRAGYHDWL